MRGEYDKAFFHYDIALESDRNLTQAWYNIGALLFASGKYCDSARAFEEVVKINPDDVNALTRLDASQKLCE